MPRLFSTLSDAEQGTRRLAILILIYLIPSFQAMLPIDDPDIWIHLRTGQWILEHGRVPMEDPFSAYGMGKAWIAYSWLFEVIVYVLYKRLGLMGLVLFTVIISLLIALTVHLFVRAAKLPFMAEAALVAVALGSMKPAFSPRPWLFSILFFAIELLILFRVKRSGQSRLLFALPPLFALWANLHIQFVYGLAALGLFFVDAVLRRHFSLHWSENDGSSTSPTRLLVVLLTCVLATLATPYHCLLYYTVFEYSIQTEPFRSIQEFHPLFFRDPSDWLVLALALGAAFVLGWRRSWLPFEMLLFMGAALLAFRARRDVWVLVLTAAGIIGEIPLRNAAQDFFKLTRWRSTFVAIGVLLSLFLIKQHRGISESRLEQVVENSFPAKAVGFIRENGYSGPLFNNRDWGGYLIWSLPEIPVSMDGRTDLHGDIRLNRAMGTWGGYSGWDSNSELWNARLVIAGISRPLTSLLRMDTRFKLVYEDTTAAVFVAADGNERGRTRLK